MKLALVDLQLPSSRSKHLGREPVGMMELGAYAHSRCDIDVEYIVVHERNADVSTILQHDPDVVGFSTYSYNYPEIVQLARQIKTVSSQTKIVLGGPHSGACAEETYQENKGIVNAVLTGPQANFIEAESALVEYLEKSEDGVYRGCVLLPDDIPFSDRKPEWFLNSRLGYNHFTPEQAPTVYASRGCSRRCNFCLSRETIFRPRSPERFINELHYLQSKYSVKTFLVEDPLLNGSIRHLDALCDAILSKKETRTLHQDTSFVVMCDFVLGKEPRALLQKMRKAGVVQINWGIEDPRQNIRDQMNKKVSIQQEILKFAYEAGIYNRGLLMLPSPMNSESQDDLENYVAKLNELYLQEIKINITTPFPGTPDYASKLAQGEIIVHDWEMYDTNHLVFRAGTWTTERVEAAMAYIEDKFCAMPAQNGKYV